jgi:diguanylate cyclase (GGDEF)-like protein/PAS domain S-box-containing protein
VWDWDVKNNIIWRNDGAERLFGYTADEVAAELNWWKDRVHPDDRDRVFESLHRVIHSDANRWQEDYRFRRRDGTYADIQDRGYVMRDGDGHTVRMIGMMQDISDRRRAELEIEHLAYHEPVTQLSNRLAMQRALSRAMDHAASSGSGLALLLLNLNFFRDINDSLGHDTGDRLLRLVAGRLVETVADRGQVASLGGDEFAVLLPASSTAPGHEPALAAVQDCFVRPFELSGIPIKLEATAGIAFYPKDGGTPDLIWQHADVALRTAKERREPFLCYDPRINHYDATRLALIAELDAAMAADQLVLYYQPKVDLRSGVAIGVEALVRWVHPARGVISPGEFMPLAERTDLINPLTRWMVTGALRDGLALERMGFPLGVAVNLSARSLHDADFCRELIARVRETGFPLERLTVEVTETAIVSDPTRIRAGLEMFRAAGISLALDDFGVGQSSLSYLKHLPITKIKIDKSFVMELDEPHHAAIARAAIDMGRNLHFEVTAEGVEEEHAHETLRAMGCDVAQGYLFSRPVPFDELVDWLRNSQWSPLQRDTNTPALP